MSALFYGFTIKQKGIPTGVLIACANIGLSPVRESSRVISVYKRLRNVGFIHAPEQHILSTMSGVYVSLRQDLNEDETETMYRLADKLRVML